jgi:hypothetical protein
MYKYLIHKMKCSIEPLYSGQPTNIDVFCPLVERFLKTEANLNLKSVPFKRGVLLAEVVKGYSTLLFILASITSLLHVAVLKILGWEYESPE